ncbi:DUF4175 family protein [Mucilaginibacter sp.]|uniref:DUF4175 family protein n=1 Tax=Mucilaginibacter sp. TaxID=1882438 RepID=UPI0017B906F3|nr:DUF4175 family protein [Mucilaginibacter sp.]HEK19281.1 DUF4175 family protein [Bacteroidota bacterium]
MRIYYTKFLMVALPVMILLGTVVYLYLNKGNAAALSGNNAVTHDVAFCAVEKPEQWLPGIRSLSLAIKPPLYISTDERRWNKFNLSVDAGTQLAWHIFTRQPVKGVALVFDDGSNVKLNGSPDGKYWNGGKTINSPVTYRVRVGRQLSAAYAIKVIRDMPPVIHLKNVAIIRNRKKSDSLSIKINGMAADDYGLTGARVVLLTLNNVKDSPVSGDSSVAPVKSLGRGVTRYQLKRVVILPAVAVQPDSKLSFYLLARDTYGHYSRSATYTIHP